MKNTRGEMPRPSRKQPRRRDVVHVEPLSAAADGPLLLDELACEMPNDVVDDALTRPRDLGRAVEL